MKRANKLAVYAILIACLVLASSFAISDFDEVAGLDISKNIGYQPVKLFKTGNIFQAKNGATLRSSALVSARVFSSTNGNSYYIKAGGNSKKSILTFENLQPNKTYYLYRDGFTDETEIIANSEGIYRHEQDMSEPHYLQLLEENIEQYTIVDDTMGGDCEIQSIGTWNQATKTCTLIKDLSQGVYIISSNVTLDCDSHTISTGASRIENETEKNTIKNCNFTGGHEIFLKDVSWSNIIDNNFSVLDPYAMIIWNSNHNKVMHNRITQVEENIAILMIYSNSNIIAANSISNEINKLNGGGILLGESNNNMIIGNNIKWIGAGLGLDRGSSGNYVSQNIITNNQAGLEISESGNLIRYNNIESNDRHNLFVDSGKIVSVEYNWWGTISESDITAKIMDYEDNPALGHAYYRPWLTGPVETTLPCFNGIKDADETDTDCGGPTCTPCDERKSCEANGDCTTGYCNIESKCDVPADLYIEWIKPIQVVEDVPLVAGKATVVRVKVVNNGPETDTDVSVNYNNGCHTETKTVNIKAFSSEIVNFYPAKECTHT